MLRIQPAAHVRAAHVRVDLRVVEHALGVPGPAGAAARRFLDCEAMSVVKPEYGPPLTEVLSPVPRAVRIALAVLAAVVVGVALFLALGGAAEEETEVLVREPVTFNLAYGSRLERGQEPGALLALQRSDDGLFLDSYVVRELVLPPYEGAASGTLPLFAAGMLERLEERYESFRLVREGRARVNNAVGYELIFYADRGERTLYGRHVLLVPEEPEGLRRGVVLELLSTNAAGTPNVTSVGSFGALQTPLRSFRFGTERSGGEA